MNMKKIRKNMLVILTCALIFTSALSSVLSDNEENEECIPNVLLPSDPVTIVVTDGTITYFNHQLSDIPEGDYDVYDDVYPGWCVQMGPHMPRDEEISVLLYSSYDSDMPEEYMSENWSKINYLLNNRGGFSRMAVQRVIWHLLDFNSIMGANEITLLDMVDSNSDDFCPGPGDVIAILCVNTTHADVLQRTIFELRLPQCARTQGYWKNHPDAWPVDVEEITIGGITYTKDDAIDILKTPVKKDMSIAMFYQLVAAKLNVLNGCESSCIEDTIKDADTWMAKHPVESNVKASSDAWAEGEPLKDMLDDYNNGLLCASHCTD